MTTRVDARVLWGVLVLFPLLLTQCTSDENSRANAQVHENFESGRTELVRRLKEVTALSADDLLVPNHNNPPPLIAWYEAHREALVADVQSTPAYQWSLSHPSGNCLD